jgi:RNA polymerase sigma factor (sigma-70 family)
MAESATFTDFIRRIRAGDEAAATELVRRYEPLIRREVRLHFEDRERLRLFDSMDICQSVLASFFARTAAGQFELERPEQLVGLLVSMARNKVVSAARAEHRQRRDQRRLHDEPLLLAEVPSRDPTPSELAAGRELLDRLRQGLSAEERRLSELRSEGLAWSDIAARLGGNPQARRMQLARAIERVARELRLDEG